VPCHTCVRVARQSRATLTSEKVAACDFIVARCDLDAACDKQTWLPAIRMTLVGWYVFRDSQPFRNGEFVYVMRSGFSYWKLRIRNANCVSQWSFRFRSGNCVYVMETAFCIGNMCEHYMPPYFCSLHGLGLLITRLIE